MKSCLSNEDFIKIEKTVSVKVLEINIKAIVVIVDIAQGCFLFL